MDDVGPLAGEPRWLAIARGEIGVHETPGPESTARIVEYHSTTTLRATSDEVAWCSSFVNWSLKQAGIVGTNSARAASWIEWGDNVPDDADRIGSVVVLYNARIKDRSLTASGYHVTLELARNADGIYCLGGNQSNSVKATRYPFAAGWEIKARRWPRVA